MKSKIKRIVNKVFHKYYISLFDFNKKNVRYAVRLGISYRKELREKIFYMNILPSVYFNICFQRFNSLEKFQFDCFFSKFSS